MHVAQNSATVHNSADADTAAGPRVQISVPQLNYQHRGPTLAAWPWYFYTAGVRGLPTRHRVDASERRRLLDMAHPDCDRWPQHVFLSRQHVLSRQPWRSPLLVRPDIPSKASDASSRAAVSHLLFRPWIGPPYSVLRRSDASPELLRDSWQEAFSSWLESLHAVDAAKPSQEHRETYTPLYWTKFYCPLERGEQGIRENPNSADGVPHASEVCAPSLRPGNADLEHVAPGPEPDLEEPGSIADTAPMLLSSVSPLPNTSQCSKPPAFFLCISMHDEARLASESLEWSALEMDQQTPGLGNPLPAPAQTLIVLSKLEQSLDKHPLWRVLHL